MASNKYVDNCGGLKPIVHPPLKKGQGTSKTAKKTVKRPSKSGKK